MQTDEQTQSIKSAFSNHSKRNDFFASIKQRSPNTKSSPIYAIEKRKSPFQRTANNPFISPKFDAEFVFPPTSSCESNMMSRQAGSRHERKEDFLNDAGENIKKWGEKTFSTENQTLLHSSMGRKTDLASLLEKPSSGGRGSCTPKHIEKTGERVAANKSGFGDKAGFNNIFSNIGQASSIIKASSPKETNGNFFNSSDISTNSSSDDQGVNKIDKFKSIMNSRRNKKEMGEWRVECVDGRVRIMGSYNEDLDLYGIMDDVSKYIDPAYAEVMRSDLGELASKKTDMTGGECEEIIFYFLDGLKDYIDEVSIVQVVPHRRLTCLICGDRMTELDMIQTHVESFSLYDNGISSVAKCNSCGTLMTDNVPIVNYGPSMSGLGGTLSSSMGGGRSDGSDSVERAVVSDHNSYDDKDNFTKAWRAFHGMHNPKLPEDLFEKLDEYFVLNGLKTGAEYRAMPLVTNIYGEKVKEGTSSKRMFEALRAIGYPLYLDMFYIRNVYWGWPLPNALHLKEIVFRNYDRTQNVYKYLKGTRKSSLNAQYRLYQELRAAGYKCSHQSFNIVETGKILALHDEVRREMCRLASQDGGGVIEFFPIDD
jgi:hypothetical protein